MKHLKQYEEENYKTPLWIIKSYQPYLDISIEKLNLIPQQKKYLLDNEYINHTREYRGLDGEIIKFDKIYIKVAENIEEIYYWDVYINGFEQDISPEKRYKFDFKGELPITDQEILNWKINNTAKKYNL